MIRNLLAFIGVLAIIVLIGGGLWLSPVLGNMDAQSRAMFSQMATKVIRDKQQPVDAMVSVMAKEDTDENTKAMLSEVMKGVMDGGEPIDTMFNVMLKDFDPKALDVYKNMMTKLLNEKDPANAMVFAVQAEEGMSADDVKDSMKSIATNLNMFFVSDSLFYKQAEAVTGKPYRHVSFMSFCDVRTGMKMADYNDAYTAMMPCTISVVEKTDGSIWLYAIDMDFMIYGGKELPVELKTDAIVVRDKLRKIMEGAAKGEF